MHFTSIDWVAISAIATLVMATVTFWSLFQNRKQLAELKKQWNEQNKPRLIPLLVRINGYVCLRIKNYSNSAAYNIDINIESPPIHNIEENIEKINNVKYILEPNGFKDLKLFVDYNPEITAYEGCLRITLEYNEIYKEKHTLFFTELNATLYIKPMHDIFEEINKNLRKL